MYLFLAPEKRDYNKFVSTNMKQKWHTSAFDMPFHVD